MPRTIFKPLTLVTFLNGAMNARVIFQNKENLSPVSTCFDRFCFIGFAAFFFKVCPLHVTISCLSLNSFFGKTICLRQEMSRLRFAIKLYNLPIPTDKIRNLVVNVIETNSFQRKLLFYIPCYSIYILNT